MKTRHKVLLVASLLGISLLTTWLIGTHSDEAGSYSSSTYSTRPSGCRAVYDLFAELQLPVRRLKSRYSRLDSRKGILVVVDPHVVPITAREIKKLNNWIEAGNSLIVFSGGPRYLPKPPSFLASRPVASGAGLSKEHSLASKLGLKLSSNRGTSRVVLDVSSLGLHGVDKVSASRFSRWKKLPSGWKTLVGDEAGAAIAKKRVGKGEIVAISDASIPSNRNVASQQNARLVTALALEKGRPRAILFDEYHHGYSLAESFWSFAGSSVFGWILLQALVGFFLFFYGKRAKVSGRFRSLARPAGRSSLEYVESMAHILESSKASRLVLETLLQRFLVLLSRRTGVPLKRLEQEDQKHPPIHDATAWGVVEKCRQAARLNPSSRVALPLARKLTALQAGLKGRGSARRVA